MNIVIVGGSKEETSTLQTLAEASSVKMLCLAEDTGDKEFIELAKSLDIPVVQNLKSLLERTDIDIIIDLSGRDDVAREITENKPSRTEVIDKSIANLICQILDSESRATYDLIDKLTREHWSLYEIGINLSSAKDLSEVSKTIVQHATQLTNTPAGSLAVYDEKSGTMYFAAMLGFSPDMAAQHSWKLRPGGLTSYILNQNGPVIISDIKKHPGFDSPQLLKEGIRALIACPLFLDNKVVGIIYIDDFKVREFDSRDTSILCLFSTYAAIAIEKAKLLDEAKMLAITDDLTKLYNHRHFNQQLGAEMIRAKRYKESLSLILLDIDHFKQYNDVNGHVKGNEVLKQVSDILQRECRTSDIIARYGGEEFTVICPKTDKIEAYQIANRLREKIQAHDFPYAHTQPLARVTISAGVATYPEDADEPLDLIEKADAGLYLAKRRGRNRVCAYPGLKSNAG